ncbi:dihydroxyacetone kinase phosphoryl donor subunit DhaM [Catellatospora sp. KI3]|uniref:dihydroxyacetone kinase phosphoryl donor subunit DhaM n=1 Tax=Catellatospora sp. KI3 TaxID=3041620 RepID=UPI002483250F|nr:dihydroxyacetone kinase phosphoryl donor subunit DhaM [Catellatospora sp. KI3]MDI1462532.1 dihydroxyacetone kinase phosphoryl donor subunit DhaM [Catellatospora sp. KI3]
MTSTVSIVLVSHSALLVAGVRELLRQVAGEHVGINTAGGTEDGGLGTGYDLVRTAIDDADDALGVVVIPDLGSSVLTAKAVLDDEPREKVVLLDVPFVEGALAAAVIAATGADLDTVVAAAREAWDARKL